MFCYATHYEKKWFLFWEIKQQIKDQQVKEQQLRQNKK